MKDKRKKALAQMLRAMKRAGMPMRPGRDAEMPPMMGGAHEEGSEKPTKGKPKRRSKLRALKGKKGKANAAALAKRLRGLKRG